MDYYLAKGYLKHIGTYGSVYGLERMKELLYRLGNPQENLTCIHVAGTNGKGSVIAYLSHILMHAGYRTGRYTSPAVFSDTECFVVNHMEITRAQFGRLIEKVKKAADDMLADGYSQPTVFEIETAMVFLFFEEEQCDITLLECGLGGSLDATNIISAPICTVITSIDYDHMKILGNTLTEIAEQKAGIIKPESKVVSAKQKKEVEEILRGVCREKGVSLTFTESAKSIKLCMEIDTDEQEKLQTFEYGSYRNLQIPLLGEHQVRNAVVALDVIPILQEKGFQIGVEDIYCGLKETEWKGRFTCIHTAPDIYIDGAHNKAAALELKSVVQSFPQNKKWTFIIGVLADKQYEEIVRHTAEYASQIFTITSEHERALSAHVLAQTISKYNHNVRAADSLEQAVQMAVQAMGEDGILLAFGSLSFLNNFTEIIENHMFQVNKIIKNDVFLKCIQQLEILESERIFCKHNLSHLMDVARIAHIMNQERELGFSKEIIYASALLHDIGRVKQYEEGMPHEETSAYLASTILSDCGFQRNEIIMITDAIAGHVVKKDIPEDSLAEILFEADKKSRLCFACPSVEQCNWGENKKNKIIMY